MRQFVYIYPLLIFLKYLSDLIVIHICIHSVYIVGFLCNKYGYNIVLLKAIRFAFSAGCWPPSQCVAKQFSSMWFLLGLRFRYWDAVYDLCKWSSKVWPVGRVRLFVYCISLSSLCRLIWRHWTSLKYLLVNIQCCVPSAHLHRLWWLWKCIPYLIIIIKSKVSIIWDIVQD